MRTNLGADAVFQWGDDFSTRRIVLGVGGEDEEDVERKTQGIALNLNVAFLHDVEESDLNFAGQIGEFINGKDAAIGAWEKAVVDGEFVGEVAAAASGADGIDITDDVGHSYVGGGELFDEAIVAGHPRDGSIVAVSDDFFSARAANRF